MTPLKISSSAISKLSTTIVIGLVIGLWQCGVETNTAVGTLPSLAMVMSDMFSLWFVTAVPVALWNTISVWTLAVSIGCLLGYCLGLSVGLTRPYSNGIYYLVNALRTIPVTVGIPVSLAFFGLRGFILPLLIVPITAMMAANVADSVVNANLARRQLHLSYGIARWSYFRHVLIYETMEIVFATLRVALPFALALEVALDYFLQTNEGIGKLIALMYQAQDGAKMYAAIFTLALFGVAVVHAFDTYSKRALKWKQGT